MCWVGRGYNSFQAEVDVTNVVAGGLQLKCSKPVVNGTHVKVLGEAMEIVGSIVYCNPDASGYLIGIQMSRDPYEKNCRDYKE